MNGTESATFKAKRSACLESLSLKDPDLLPFSYFLLHSTPVCHVTSKELLVCGQKQKKRGGVGVQLLGFSCIVFLWLWDQVCSETPGSASGFEREQEWWAPSNLEHPTGRGNIAGTGEQLGRLQSSQQESWAMFSV